MIRWYVNNFIMRIADYIGLVSSFKNADIPDNEWNYFKNKLPAYIVHNLIFVYMRMKSSTTLVSTLSIGVCKK